MARLNAEDRRRQIVLKACEISARGDLYEFTLRDISRELDISLPGVKYYFYSATSLRTDVILKSIEVGHLDVLAQAIAAYDPLVEGLDVDLHFRAVESLK